MASASIARISLLIFVSSLAAPSSSLAFSPSDANKVSVALYYESLCPYSANFVINYLTEIFEDDLIGIVDLKLVPWGNARIRENNTFDCQHGPSECLLNTIEACAIDVWPELDKHFPLINCIETLAYKRKYQQWEKCFEELGLDAELIAECYGSGHGEELELEYAAETDRLQPPHKYVPWVVVDGKPLYEEYEDFISYICKAYKGPDVPSACSKASLKGVLKVNPVDHHSVCYTQERVKGTLLTKVASAVNSWGHRKIALFTE